MDETTSTPTTTLFRSTTTREISLPISNFTFMVFSPSPTSSLNLYHNATTAASNNTQPGDNLNHLPNGNIGLAALAPAVFVVLVIAAIYTRSSLKGKTVLEAAAYQRNLGVEAGGEGSSESAREVAAPVIAIPMPPRTPKRGRSRRGGRRVVREGEEGLEMQRLSLDPDIISPGTPQIPYQQTKLRYSNFYSPNYEPSPHHSPLTKQIDALRDGRSVSAEAAPTLPNIDLEGSKKRTIPPQDGHFSKPVTSPPTLPPLPSPDIGSNWMPNPDSPTKLEIDQGNNVQIPIDKC